MYNYKLYCCYYIKFISIWYVCLSIIDSMHFSWHGLHLHAFKKMSYSRVLQKVAF